VSEAGRLIAIGDVHGRLSRLVGLLGQIDPQPEDQLVFWATTSTGGSDSYELVERLVAFRRDFPRTLMLRGNHEAFVLSFFRNLVNGQRQSWSEKDGGSLTVASYRRPASSWQCTASSSSRCL
jgi:serine/threonine protein phosphatase 1